MRVEENIFDGKFFESKNLEKILLTKNKPYFWIFRSVKGV